MCVLTQADTGMCTGYHMSTPQVNSLVMPGTRISKSSNDNPVQSSSSDLVVAKTLGKRKARSWRRDASRGQMTNSLGRCSTSLTTPLNSCANRPRARPIAMMIAISAYTASMPERTAVQDIFEHQNLTLNRFQSSPHSHITTWSWVSHVVHKSSIRAQKRRRIVKRLILCGASRQNSNHMWWEGYRQGYRYNPCHDIWSLWKHSLLILLQKLHRCCDYIDSIAWM